MKNLKNLLVLPVAYVSLALFSCRQSNKATQKMMPDVQVITAAEQTVPIYSEYVGQTFGENDVQIQARVSGIITGIFFKDGQWVKKGSLLYTIDDLPLLTEIDGYKADLAKSVTMMTNSKADLERIKPLAEMKALSQHDLDAAVAGYQAAESVVKISQARLRDMQIQLGYTQIKAPLSGTIGISNVRVGGYIGGGSGTAILNTISATSNIKVRFPISEIDYLRFIKRMKSDKAYNQQIITEQVQLLLADGSIYEQRGQLDMANRQVDPETGSLVVEALFANPAMILKPGQYVKIRLKTDVLTNAVLVPQQAVNEMQDIYQVYLLNDSNKIVPRMIKPGQRIGTNWVITGGLKAGEKLALLGSAFIKPNIPVHPVPVNWNYETGKATN
ncbi:MAG TPA: efflux RND transporter periplasmic adaptor subunit [Mucilaginibacter sp.]